MFGLSSKRPVTRDGPLPEQVTMGLLPYLTAHAVDEDYAIAARRRRQGHGHHASGDGDRRRRVGVAGAAALAVFAVLAVTAGVQTARNSASEERERRALIDQVTERKAAVAANQHLISQLQSENAQLQSDQLHDSATASGVLEELRLLELRSGTSAVHGPGVEIVADDAENADSPRGRVLDSDLQKLVNGLWRAGAEAISINGERLTSLSAIRNAGGAISVNFTKLNRPYRILAIGDPKNLPPLFAQTTTGRAWLDLPGQVGLRFQMHTRSSLRLPAADTPDLRYASTTRSPQGKEPS
jgi:uncharacterized protein YlxW (UPF0749 family)